MTKSFTLSAKEKELMQILWNSDCALSRSEILERADWQKVSWKPNSIHILLNSLMEKGAVEVDGFYLDCRKLGRNFKAAVTPEEYSKMQVILALDEVEKLLKETPTWISDIRKILI